MELDDDTLPTGRKQRARLSLLVGQASSLGMRGQAEPVIGCVRNVIVVAQNRRVHHHATKPTLPTLRLGYSRRS
ncbi:hypothetical protein EVAR_53827_1 [Eumeta japonica]|uniref:Uncharacterized protein n=1 Tax=Eumeta variegata TaxID=151549 RepID=A0A4C1ZD24_EUMVA|nr:hypothetical protein EVAR_53827_1 [Eumeta japonica]